MADDWHRTTLGEIGTFLSGGTPSKSREEYWHGSLPWVSAKDMKRLRLTDTEDHITEEAAQSGSRVVPVGTVLLLTRGMTLLKDVPICVVGRPMAFNQDVKAFKPSKQVACEFVPYLLLANEPHLLDLVDLAGHGTGRLNTDALRSLDVSLPPIREQQAIAAILGAFDDKIELNRRMSETLEAMARALFKSWFVDFDPVRAKERRKPSSLPDEVLSHFPSRLVDGGGAPVPDGWSFGRLDEEFVVTMGQSPPGNTYNTSGEGMPFYQGRTDFGPRFPTRRVFCTAPTRLASVGDTLVSVRAPVGDVNMAAEDCAIGRGVAAVRHRSGSTSFTYWSMVHLSAAFKVFEAEGTVFGSIGQKDFLAIEVVKPPRDVVAAFEDLTGPIESRIALLQREQATAAELRDTLLPRLISGELRVPDAKWMAVEAGA